MIKRSAILLIVVIMAALAPIRPRHAMTAGATSRVATAATMVLYQADWANGVDGWKVYPGFTVSHGMLAFDGASDSGTFAPFRLNGLADFAVEATIKLGTSTKPEQAYAELFARRASARTITGLFAGYAANGGEKAATNVASLYWYAFQPYYAPGAALQPDAGFHTYRLEVHGNMYRFLIDGREMVPWTRVNLLDPGDLVGLVFTYIPATVKTFMVFALPATRISTPLDTSALLGHVIPANDIPFPADRAVFRDNNRYALDNNVDLATVQRTGRVYGYSQGFENQATYVEQSVNLHQSPAGAQAVFDLFAGRIRHDASRFQGYHEVDVSAQKIGDESFAFGYQYLLQGRPSYVLKVLFHRGNYYVGITVDSANQRVPQKAIAYARLADKFVQGTVTGG
jgi:hypothetical protein